jgi:PPM family protein phosphatase
MDTNTSNIPSKYIDSHKTKYGLLALRTRIGGRKENQDSLGFFETNHGLLIVVCDGMGGAKGGSTASKLAIETIFEQVGKTQQHEPEQILTEAIKQANQILYLTGNSNPDLQGMGTTVAALLINEEKATVAHVGDSRVYQLRGSQKVFRTFDHSMVFELVKRGTLTEEQARLSAESNVILRALGTKPDVEIELSRNIPYMEGDRFLLCSDGISGAMPEKELLKLIRKKKSVDIAAESIAHEVDLIGINNGGNHDNLTAALIELKSNSKIRPKMDKVTKTIIGIILILLIISVAVNIWQGCPKKSANITSQTDTTVIDSEITNLSNRIAELEKTNRRKNDTIKNYMLSNEKLLLQIEKIRKIQTVDSVNSVRTRKIIKDIYNALQSKSNDSSKLKDIEKILVKK